MRFIVRIQKVPDKANQLDNYEINVLRCETRENKVLERKKK